MKCKYCGKILEYLVFTRVDSLAYHTGNPSDDKLDAWIVPHPNGCVECVDKFGVGGTLPVDFYNAMKKEGRVFNC